MTPPTRSDNFQSNSRRGSAKKHAVIASRRRGNLLVLCSYSHLVPVDCRVAPLLAMTVVTFGWFFYCSCAVIEAGRWGHDPTLQGPSTGKKGVLQNAAARPKDFYLITVTSAPTAVVKASTMASELTPYSGFSMTKKARSPQTTACFSVASTQTHLRVSMLSNMV